MSEEEIAFSKLIRVKRFKKELKALLKAYGYEADRLLVHFGENNGIKGGEITKYF